jgi:hypothetical protein
MGGSLFNHVRRSLQARLFNREMVEGASFEFWLLADSERAPPGHKKAPAFSRRRSQLSLWRLYCTTWKNRIVPVAVVV